MASGRADEGHGIQWKFDQLTCHLKPIKKKYLYKGKIKTITYSHVRIVIITQEEMEDAAQDFYENRI